VEVDGSTVGRELDVHPAIEAAVLDAGGELRAAVGPGADAHELVRVRRAERAQRREVVDRLDEVRLPLAVVAVEDVDARPGDEVEGREVPPPLGPQLADTQERAAKAAW